MKLIVLLIISHLSLVAAELRVTFPNDGRGHVLVEAMSKGDSIDNPEQQIAQEGQISVLDFKNLKSGKYRVSYLSASDPLGYLETLMETHIEIGQGNKYCVTLFQPWRGGSDLPKDIQDFLMQHRQNYLELNAVYDGFEKSFGVTRGSFGDISKLRTDCVYSIKVWDHSYQEYKEDRKVILEKTFRAVASESNNFGIDERPENAKTEKDGGGHPTARPGSK